MGLSPARGKIDMEGGVTRVDLKPGEIRATVSGGQLTGLLHFDDIQEKAKVSLDLEGGVASLAMDVPEEVGIIVSVDRKGGMFSSTLRQREGIKGKVEVEAKVRGGLLDLKDARVENLDQSNG
jgi:hypothetical protein